MPRTPTRENRIGWFREGRSIVGNDPRHLADAVGIKVKTPKSKVIGVPHVVALAVIMEAGGGNAFCRCGPHVVGRADEGMTTPPRPVKPWRSGGIACESWVHSEEECSVGKLRRTGHAHRITGRSCWRSWTTCQFRERTLFKPQMLIPSRTCPPNHPVALLTSVKYLILHS